MVVKAVMEASKIVVLQNRAVYRKCGAKVDF